MTIRDIELIFLEGVIERSKERRRTFFGERKTTKAEVAEIVLAAYAPALLAEVKRLRANGEQGET
jgi:hypothetical protein